MFVFPKRSLPELIAIQAMFGTPEGKCMKCTITANEIA